SLQADTILVRPFLEYASPVWDLYTQKHVEMIAAVQRGSVHFIKRGYKDHQTLQEGRDQTLQEGRAQTLQEGRAQTLQEGRAQTKVTLFHQAVKQLVDIQLELYHIKGSKICHKHNFNIPPTTLKS
ncbi:hypothetical protein LSAT2_013200, partial [Lamellibrachia satsuma]